MLRLSLKMGIPPRELRSRLTAAELVEFMGFSLLEPFGDHRDDERARGVMAMALVAQGAKNVDASEFLKTWEPPQERVSDNGLAAFLSRLDRLALPSDREAIDGNASRLALHIAHPGIGVIP